MKINQWLTAVFALTLLVGTMNACSGASDTVGEIPANKNNTNSQLPSGSSDSDDQTADEDDNSSSDPVVGSNNSNSDMLDEPLNNTTETPDENTEEPGDDVEEPDEEVLYPPYDCYFPPTDPTCPNGPYGPASFINQFTLVENTTCCFDFTGNKQNDNFLGTIVSAATMFGADINQEVARVIETGELVYLIEYMSWSHPMQDSNIQLNILAGKDTDQDFSDNLLGFGDFLVLEDSFDENGDPRWGFEEASVINGVLVATGGSMQLNFPELLDEVTLRAVNVRIQAEVFEEPGREADLTAGGRVRLRNGEIAGGIERDTLFESINVAAESCDCLRKPLFSYNSTSDLYACLITEEDKAGCHSDPWTSPGCRNLAEPAICEFLAMQSSRPDIDTTGDGNKDAYSFGARFNAEGASLVGTAP